MSDSKQNRDNRWHAWVQWKERCAWAKCDGAVREVLGNFVFQRLKTSFSREPAREQEWSAVRFDDFFSSGNEEKNLELAFVTFESFAAEHKEIKGKREKDWLFEGASLSGVEGYSTRIIQTELIRELTGRKRRTKRQETFDHTAVPDRSDSGEHNSVSGEVVKQFFQRGVPSHQDIDAYEKHASTVGNDVFSKASHIARVAHVAKLCGISTADPQVNASAGAQKSKLSSCYREFLEDVGYRIDEEEFAPGDDAEMRFFARLVIGNIDRLAIAWAKKEENLDWAASTLAKEEKNA